MRLTRYEMIINNIYVNNNMDDLYSIWIQFRVTNLPFDSPTKLRRLIFNAFSCRTSASGISFTLRAHFPNNSEHSYRSINNVRRITCTTSISVMTNAVSIAGVAFVGDNVAFDVIVAVGVACFFLWGCNWCMSLGFSFRRYLMFQCSWSPFSMQLIVSFLSFSAFGWILFFQFRIFC